MLLGFIFIFVARKNNKYSFVGLKKRHEQLIAITQRMKLEK
ncbi:hypothetical protein P872_05350 [Rhodonellum psychrophilum GCM71 = DSM 17998]|uniref:Uncharacterized protein n=1 Tax=Rhodonellum psychrophilum GCM71 = DSM 17998 TaxID=1123057 RepID=U5BQN7_9BACT|nr:hypothetical protein P872_05350 [Rhodonellum psychrophilum GCM71 = DSM 17998]